MFEENSYIEDIQNFKKITSSEADKFLSTEDLSVVYIGRGTCPFCRKFAKKLSGLTDKINTTIYYVDSQDYSDDNLKTFRSKYNIITVPGFIVKKNNEVEVRCDSSTPEDEILDMLNK